jgi:repressor LexA
MSEKRRDYRNRVLRFIELFMEENGYPPTYEEIRESVGLSSRSHVDYYVESLEEAKLIERKARSPRSLRPLSASPSPFELRLEGMVASDQSIAWAEGEVQTIEVTADIADRRRDLFCLRVQGNSMLEELVGDGDILIIERSTWASSGEVAVVYLTDRAGATLSRVYPEGDKVRLQPGHPSLPPVVDAGQMQIQGRLITVVRQT